MHMRITATARRVHAFETFIAAVIVLFSAPPIEKPGNNSPIRDTAA